MHKTSTESTYWEGECNGHDVRDNLAVFRENQRLGGKVSDEEPRRGFRLVRVSARAQVAAASGQRIQRHAATTVAAASVILSAQDHDRGTRVSTRKGQYSNMSTRWERGERTSPSASVARFGTSQLVPASRLSPGCSCAMERRDDA